MNKKIRISALLLAILMIVSTSACGRGEKSPEESGTSQTSTVDTEETNNTNSDTSSETKQTDTEESNANGQTSGKTKVTGSKSKKTKATPKETPKGFYDSIKGSKVTIYASDKPSDLMKKTQQQFEKKYGCTVVFDVIPWADWHTKFPQQVSAGKTVDVAPLFDTEFANYAATGMFQSVESYVEINDPIWDKNIMDLFKWKGKHYGLYTKLRSYAQGMIFFNKTMFEDEGEDDPYTLYKKGKWDLNQFRQTALAMRRLGKDGKTSVYGFGTWWYDAFILSNGNRQVVPQSDGSVKITLNQQSAYDAMQLIQDMQLKDKSFDYTLSSSWADYFMGGKMAMVYERPWNVAGVYNMYDKKNFPYELGVAPPPKGLNTGNTYYAPSIIEATGIPAKASNPKAGAAWIYFSSIYARDNQNDPVRISDRRRMLSDEHKKIVDGFLDKATPINSMINGFGNWYYNRWPMWAAIYRDNIPPATAVAQHLNELQYEIDQTLQGTIGLDD